MDHLLRQFEKSFRGRIYRQRVSTTGDTIALYLYEDLLQLGESLRLAQRIKDGRVVINTSHKIKGKATRRRGDGTFGRLIPEESAEFLEGFHVGRGPVAKLEIAAEVKNRGYENDRAGRSHDERSH